MFCFYVHCDPVILLTSFIYFFCLYSSWFCAGVHTEVFITCEFTDLRKKAANDVPVKVFFNALDHHEQAKNSIPRQVSMPEFTQLRSKIGIPRIFFPQIFPP